MVTVSILSLLLAMSVPTFRIVMRAANDSVCVSNLRELHRGMLVYETEHGRFNMWHKNFNEYSRSHHIYESIWQGHGDHLRPLGFQGLGLLVGYNPSWLGPNYYNWPPDWGRSPEAQINAYKAGGGAAGKAPWKTMRYISSPTVFYCPEMQLGYQTGWYSHLKWTEPWTNWPNGPDGEGYVYCTYTMRPGSRLDWNIPGDQGLARSAPAWGGQGNIWPERELGAITPGNTFPGQALISDCNSSKVYVPNCHQNGTNVVYRDGSVAFVEDDGSMTTLNITNLGEGFAADGATRLVNIWTLYDDRYNP
jgi:hypothetical protein